MKLSLGRAARLALLFGIVALGGTAACALGETEAMTPPPPEPGDAGTQLPDDEEELDAGAEPAEDAAVADAGPKTCSDHGFCPTDLPGGQTVTGLWGDGAGVVWAVTEEGDLLRWDGSAWAEHASGLGKLNAIWGSGPTNLWIGGTQGLKHGTGETSATLTLAPVTLPAPSRPPPVLSIWGASADDVWAVASAEYGEVGYAYHFTGDGEGGGSWALDPVSSSGVVFTRVWGGHGTVWLGGSRYSDETWSNQMMVVYKTPESDGFAEAALPADPLLDERPWEQHAPFTGAVVSSGTAVTFWGQPEASFVRPSVWNGTSSDGGKTFAFTWSPDHRRDTPRINATAGSAANDVWAAGEYGRFIRWDGKAWSTVAISIDGQPVPDPFGAVWVGGPSEIWVGGKDMALRFDPAHAKSGGVQ